MKKNALIIGIIVILNIFCSLSIFGETTLVDDVVFLTGEKYFTEVQKAIKGANKSIYLVMFKTGARDYDYHPVNELIQDLIEAHERGVQVQVILENSMSSNRQAYSLLTKEGIDVKFDSNSILTHTKLLVVDDYLTIGGSHNWTMGAFQYNNDSSVLIKSQVVAKKCLTHIEFIQQTATATPPPATLDGYYSGGKTRTDTEPTKPVKPVIFRDVSTILPSEVSAQVHLQMGYNYYQNKMYDKAIQEFKRAIEIDPKHVQAYYYLNLCYQETKQED